MSTTGLLKYFEDIREPRHDNHWHLLKDIIAIVICGSICGAEKWDDIEAFGYAKEEWLKTFLKLPHGIPGSDTYRRVFTRLDPEEFKKRFFDWVAAINPKHQKEIISIDGKTLRGSYDSGRNQSPVHMVSAWANKAGLTLGQIKVDEKSNEITAIPELLDNLDVKDCIVTIDAMGTQKKIAEKIMKKEGDYILALKGNQETLQEDVKTYFQETKPDDLMREPFSYHKTFEKDHGRLETREYWATGDTDWLSANHGWEGLRSIVMAKMQRTIGDKTSCETQYYISSLPPNGEEIGNAIRAHWGIENSLHWVLDVAFREDECRKRRDNSPQNFTILRHITLNLLKQEKTCKRSIAGKRLVAGWDNTYLEKVLFSG